jgi:hypothetical protein
MPNTTLDRRTSETRGGATVRLLGSLALFATVATAFAQQPQGQGDDRRFWRYAPAHGSGSFKLLDNGKWVEVAPDGRLMGTWDELDRTPEYVEVYDPKRNYLVRLGAGKAWLAHGRDPAKLNPSPHGDWERPGGKAPAPAAARPAPAQPDYERMKREWVAKTSEAKEDEVLKSLQDKLRDLQARIAKAREEARPAIEAKLRTAREELRKGQEQVKDKPTPEQRLMLASLAGTVAKLERDLAAGASTEVGARGLEAEGVRRRIVVREIELKQAHPKQVVLPSPDEVRVGFFGKLSNDVYSSATDEPTGPAGAPEGSRAAAVAIAQATSQAGQSGRAELPYRILQVIDQNNVILTWGPDVTWWVEMPTAGLADGQTIKITDFVHCVGTRQYRTTFGRTRTVLVLKVVP